MRAILSVYDKTGIEPFARGLVDLAALDPLGRLGGEEYCRVTGVRSIPRA